MKRVMVDMSATILHHGHVRILEKAKELGDQVVVALTTDEDVRRFKGYEPELNFEYRRELLLALQMVDEVVPTPFYVTDEFLTEHNIDLLLHGSDNQNPIDPSKLHIIERTKSVSSSEIRERSMQCIVNSINQKKKMFTPGPGCLLVENLIGLKPAFGRGDESYAKVESRVLEKLSSLSGHANVVRLQGSATLALEIAIANFVCGSVVVVDTGYYASRLYELCKLSQKRKGAIIKLLRLSEGEFMDYNSPTDWVVSVYTETARGYRAEIVRHRHKAEELSAKLLIDSTASIGLEDHHELGDVIAYSSCKGLFGLTGASFVAYHEKPQIEEPSFYLNLESHEQKKMTGPYHSICGLDGVLTRQSDIRKAVQRSKELFSEHFSDYLVYPAKNQPAISTKVNRKLKFHEGISYEPRESDGGSVVCHLGDTYLSLLGNETDTYYDCITLQD
tara:strand:- start:854 stop:2194 length:1341 start_codon:yes stop_codon:yes gene_type:complete